MVHDRIVLALAVFGGVEMVAALVLIVLLAFGAI
jgi:hypothetical protein